MAFYNTQTGDIQLKDPETGKMVTINTPVENFTWNSTPVTWTDSDTKSLGSSTTDSAESSSSSSIVTGATSVIGRNSKKRTFRSRRYQFLLSTPRTRVTNTVEDRERRVITSSEETKVTNTTSQASTSKTSLIPYMRQRRIEFEANGLKPNAEFGATFGGEDVKEFCTQTSGTPNKGVLKASPTGVLKGHFDLPAERFKAGIRVFKLFDESDPTLSYCTAKYTAAGRRVDQTITSSHHTEANVQKTIFDETFTSQNESSSSEALTPTQRWTGWSKSSHYNDPVAQSFYVNTTETRRGVFLHSVDLYFWYVEPGHGVSLEIRLMRDGTPTNDLVNEYAGTFLLSEDIKTSVNGTVPSRFVFDSPVYLPPNAEYCFVARTTSEKTSIWCAEMGKKSYRSTDVSDPTGEIISKQPYLGTMFVSQNDQTWDAVQMRDVKFRLNKCKFVSEGNIKFVNQSAEMATSPTYKRLKPDCIEFNGTNIAKLYCHGHGFSVGDTFQLILSDSFRAMGSTFGVNINNYLHGVNLSVTKVESTHIEFSLGVSASGSGSTGGTQIFVKGWKVAYTYAQLVKNDLQLDDTSVNYILSGKRKNNYSAAPTGSYELADSEIKLLNDTYVVKTDGDGGVTINTSMTSDGTRLSSPMIYADSIGIETHLNVINNIDFQNPDTDAVQGDSSPAKYIQKEVTLINPANELKVFFESNLPFGTNVAVYHKVAIDNVSSTQPWVRMSAGADGIAPSSHAEEWRTQSLQFNMPEGQEFSSFRVMIVLLSNDTKIVPKLKNYRAIALYA